VSEPLVTHTPGFCYPARRLVCGSSFLEMNARR
jgi:hypothetical protein